MECQRTDCQHPAAYRIAWQTRYMTAPAFYYECGEHAAQWVPDGPHGLKHLAVEPLSETAKSKRKRTTEIPW